MSMYDFPFENLEPETRKTRPFRERRRLITDRLGRSELRRIGINPNDASAQDVAEAANRVKIRRFAVLSVVLASSVTLINSCRDNEGADQRFEDCATEVASAPESTVLSDGALAHSIADGCGDVFDFDDTGRAAYDSAIEFVEEWRHPDD